MSKFNSYARKVNDIATEAFKAYRKAEADYKKAEEKAKQYPQRHGFVDAQYAAKSARAQADFLEAKEAWKKANEEFKEHNREIADLRKELAAEIDSHYAADPAAMDSATLELLKSGILKSGEYARLMQKAQDNGNYTMCRMIAKYAGDAAVDVAKHYGENSEQAREMRAISYVGNQNDGSETMGQFDIMADVFHRATNNPAMIDTWESFTADIVENM